ncbi:MAG: helix-turn-helix transcriptional regulator [Clostridia bacterium]|nr:helix-turn-helix transcriptional regulator [Clostridia bacterium]
MTQYELAELAGLPRGTVGRIERKHNTAHLYTAIVLARALNVSLDWLCGLESP